MISVIIMQVLIGRRISMSKKELVCPFLLMVLFMPRVSRGDAWQSRTSMANTRRFPVTAVVAGKIYAIGGDGTTATEEFDPMNNSWTTRASMPTVRWWGFAAGVVDDRIYAIGGATGGDYLDENEEYDPSSNTWTSMAPMPTPRHGLAVGVINDTIFAIGGRNSSGYLSVNEAYDPATDSWTSKAPMPTARYYLAVAVANGKIYAIGGYGPGGTLATVEEYDPATNTWASRTDMPTAREEHATATLNGKIYAVGGWNGVSDLGTNEEYDPILDSWATRAAMITARSGLAAASVADSLYATGGLLGFSYLATHELYYFIPTNVAEPSFWATVAAGSVFLSWTISSESGIAWYSVERKSSSEHCYREITRIQRNGHSPSSKEYAYADKEVTPGNTYWYRLGIKEINGNTQWIGPCAAAIPHQKNGVLLTPNPATTSCSIRISNAQCGNVEVLIKDAAGRIVKTICSGPLSHGIHTFQWDCTDSRENAVPSGVYFCTVSTGASISTGKFLVVR
jgi:N-acetylneuraminic acid mutarotase